MKDEEVSLVDGVFEDNGRVFAQIEKGTNTSGFGSRVQRNTPRNGKSSCSPLAPNLKDKVVQVIRISDRIMLVRLVIEEETINVISAYAPQVGLGEAEKKSFWDSLDDLVRECSTTQQLIVAGDLNGHIGANADGFSSVHGGFGYGVRNEEGRSILEFAATHDLVVVNVLQEEGCPSHHVS
ncbi:craniofacial development protein 2-like protein [Tanacetum coccineum]